MTAYSRPGRVGPVLNIFIQDGSLDGKRCRKILMPYRQGNHGIILQHSMRS
jgi:hypothetical protein